MRAAVEEARARLAVVESPRPEDFEIADVLREQAATFRHCQIQHLRIGKPSTFGAFDERDDVMPSLAETLGEQRREHLVQ